MSEAQQGQAEPVVVVDSSGETGGEQPPAPDMPVDDTPERLERMRRDFEQLGRAAWRVKELVFAVELSLQRLQGEAGSHAMQLALSVMRERLKEATDTLNKAGVF